MRDIYINSNLNSQNSLAAVEALSLKISSNGTSLKWSGINPNEQDCESHSQESK